MSKLQTRFIDDTYLEYYNTGNHDLARIYLKSEADKVITELKEERDWLAKDRAQAYDDLEKRAQLNIKQEESIRHQKYKRCLANAEACMHKRWRTDEGFEYARSTRHMNKWLELAEKFKEAK